MILLVGKLAMESQRMRNPLYLLALILFFFIVAKALSSVFGIYELAAQYNWHIMAGSIALACLAVILAARRGRVG